jgi:hypothetical protein
MRQIGLVSLAVLMLALVGCDSKPTHESLAQEAIGKMNEMAGVLEGVTDEASAKAAKPKLQAIDASMKELKAKEEKLGKLSADEEKRLKEKYEPQMEEAMKKLIAQFGRLATDPKLASVLDEAMPVGPPGM